MRIREAAFLFLFALVGTIPAYSEAPTGIRSVSISRPFFNPSLAQQVQISFELEHAGRLTALVLDRDGFVVRRLRDDSPVSSGPISLSWDGRDDRRAVVPDEAYSFKIDLVGKRGTATYFPASTPAAILHVQTRYYDRRSAVLSYRLPAAARVHIQAGTATVDPRTKTTSGPVLKTLVNREPRPAGAVVENWNGMDESGTTYVPDLNHFAIAIAATSLPQNSIITSGNRSSSFLQWAAKRTGPALLDHATGDHRHHKGLTTLDDVAPRLMARVQNATWSSRTRTWTAKARAVKVRLTLSGPSAASFAKHPSKLVVYLDQKLIAEVTKPKDGMQLEIPIKTAEPGTHLAALNWASAYGPVAVETIPIQIGKEQTLSAAARGGRR